MVTHTVTFLAPRPLWGSALSGPETTRRAEMRRPSLLRYETDAFMSEMMDDLATEPAQIGERVARPRSYQRPLPGYPAGWEAPAETLKLYQPAQGHFNLVVASLVCQQPGLPDHSVDRRKFERVSFVLRRLKGGAEQAWIEKDGSWCWSTLGAPRLLHPAEETRPMFPVTYGTDKRHRLFGGLVPTSSSETYDAAPEETQALSERADDPRADEFGNRVVEAHAALVEGSIAPGAGAEPPTTEEERRSASAFLLLDLGDFLKRYLPAVFDALGIPSGPPGTQGQVHSWLRTPRSQLGGARVSDLVLEVWDEAQRTVEPTTTRDLSRLPPAQLQALAGYVEAALPAWSPAAHPDRIEPSTGRPKLDLRSNYVIRCVFERPKCDPRLEPPVISDPSETFQLAAYFDVDAPARPVRIVLPIDTSIKALRHAQRSVSFAMSEQFREKVERVRDLKSILDGEKPEVPPINLGEVCALSIPIVTIVAFLLLMIIVNLLNFIFWWLPFVRVCLPLDLLVGGGGDDS